MRDGSRGMGRPGAGVCGSRREAGIPPGQERVVDDVLGLVGAAWTCYYESYDLFVVSAARVACGVPKITA